MLSILHITVIVVQYKVQVLYARNIYVYTCTIVHIVHALIVYVVVTDVKRLSAQTDRYISTQITFRCVSIEFIFFRHVCKGLCG